MGYNFLEIISFYFFLFIPFFFFLFSHKTKNTKKPQLFGMVHFQTTTCINHDYFNTFEHHHNLTHFYQIKIKIYFVSNKQ